MKTPSIKLLLILLMGALLSLALGCTSQETKMEDRKEHISLTIDSRNEC